MSAMLSEDNVWGRLNLSAILPNRPADSRAKCIDSPGCWTLAFAFKALPVACFTADLLSIYFCAVRLICAVSTFMWAVSFLFAQFDTFFAGSIAICASWIHLRLVRFIFEAFDLLFGGSIYFCAVGFIFGQVGVICMGFDLFSDPLIMFVHVSFCLFYDLKILAVMERHKHHLCYVILCTIISSAFLLVQLCNRTCQLSS